MYKVWFKVYKDEKFYSNNLEYPTEGEAVEKAREKFRGWTQAESWLVMPTGKDPNNGYGGKL